MDISACKLVTVLLAVLPFTAGNLTFTTTGSIDGNSLYDCNSNATFSCRFTSKPLTLLVNTSVAVNCLGTCGASSTPPGGYSYSFNSSAVSIDVYIDTFGITENYTRFTCSNIDNSTDIYPKVIVRPLRQTTEMFERLDGDTVEIQVTTSCVLLDNPLTFSWRKSLYTNGTDLEPIEGDIEGDIGEVVEDNSLCTPADHCGGTGKSSTVTFKNGNMGNFYYIFCSINASDYFVDFTLMSSNSYQLNYTEKSNSANNSHNCSSITPCISSTPPSKPTVSGHLRTILAVVIPVAVVGIISIPIIVYCCRRKNKKGKHGSNKTPSDQSEIQQRETNGSSKTPSDQSEMQQRETNGSSKTPFDQSEMQQRETNGSSKTPFDQSEMQQRETNGSSKTPFDQSEMQQRETNG